MMDIAAIVKVSKRLMLKYKAHPPVLIIEDARHVYQKTLDFLPGTTLEKQKLLFTLGNEMACEHDIEVKEVQQLIWICEAWFTQKQSIEEMERAPLPSQDPNRQEGLIVLSLTISGKQLSQSLQMIEVIRHGSILDLLPHDEPLLDVHSGLLTSCLAGVVAASLTDNEFDVIVEKARKEQHP